MADHRVGKIYIELDLDPSRYMKGQQTLLKEAQHGATVLEKNFKNLGLKSGAMYDLMRERAVRAFSTIKKSGQATSSDRIRAEKAKVETIKRINDQQYGHTTSMFDKIKKYWMATTAAIVAAWYAVGAAVRRASDIIMSAAKYETLGASLRVVGANAGYTSEQMDNFQKGLVKSGISMAGSRVALTRMAQAQLDLSKSTELARGAQDAARIGMINSTEAFNTMVYGIQSANVRVLRTIGIMVSFENAYKKARVELDRVKGSFSEAEKAGIRLDAVIEALKRIAGVYAETMGTAAGQIKSLERHFEDLGVMAGAAFTPALAEIIEQITSGIVDINGELSEGGEGIREWGVNFRITIIGIEIELSKLAMLLDKIGGTMTTVMVGLFYLGNVAGNENSQRQYTEWMKKNIEYKKRYWQTVIDIVELEEKQIALEYSLTDAGKAAAKEKADALEKTRLAAAAAIKALEEQRNAEEKTKKATEEHIKILEKAAKAMDKVTLAALPKYEQAIESIRRKYDELNKSLDKHGVLAGKTTEEIAKLHKDLSERMMDDVGKFAESFAKDVRGTVEETEKTTDKIHDTWKHMYERLQDITADWIYNMKIDFDSLVDLFKRTVAQMIAAWIWGQQNMQFMSSGQGGFSLGNMFGGIFGGGGRSGDVDVDVVNQSSGNNGINVAQGASSAWSLKGAYGAYQGAGGGWAGAKAGASSFFGGGGTAQLSLYAAAAIAAYNLYRSHRDDYESYYSTGASKYAPAPSWLQNTDYGFAKDAWGFTSDFSLAGVLAKALGFGNKKRSYLTREYEYGYDLETGWSETGMEETKEKRKGEEFRKSAEAISDALVKMLNTIDEAVSSFLDSIDKTWADKWKTAMIDFGDLGFVFKISAEDKKEFKKGWEESFSAALEGVINPVLEKATELMLEAFTGEIESSRLQAAKEILKDSVQGYLDDSIASVYEAFSAELPTTYKEFETYMENLGVGMEDAAAVLEYLNVIADIMDQISLVIELHGESDALKSATQTLIGINVQFRTFTEELSAVGVDLAKYPQLLQAWYIAIAESVEAMSSAGMSGEDLAKAIQYMADEMEEAGHSIEEVGEAVHAATMGIMDSIDELYKRHNEFGKTQAEILSEKYDFDFTGWTFEDWAAHNQQMYEDYLAQYETGIQDWADYWTSMGWTTEMLQDWRNFGAYLEDIWEKAVNSGEAFATSVGDAGRDFAEMVRGAGAGLGSGATEEVVEMQHGAIVTRPTYSLIGEAGYPEVVLPLGGGHKLKAQLEGNKSQEITVTIPLTIVTEDGKILKQETIKETLGQIKERSRRRELVIHAAGIAH